MNIFCISMIMAGIFVLGISCVKYYGFLRDLKVQLQAERIFTSPMYSLCFVLIILFMCGYAAECSYIAASGSASLQDFLIASILLGGAVFVRAIVSLVIRFGDTEQLKRRLEQEELMSKISRSFTSQKDPATLIHEALGFSADFLKVDHVFLSKYDRENAMMNCQYEYCSSKAQPFIGNVGSWPFSPENCSAKDLNKHGYLTVEDFCLYNGACLSALKDCGLRSLMSLPLEISDELWGMLGFVLYDESHKWNMSNVRIGQMLAGIFSGMIGRIISEEKLIEAKELAEAGSQSKSGFLSRMSHEMRTPMNAIIGMTSIGQKSESAERKDDCFRKIETASNQLLETINNVLDMSKIEANKFELVIKDFAVSAMLSKVETIVGQEMKSRRQHFEMSVAKDVPPRIKSDEQRITQILINLLGNATKFTPEQGTISLFVRKLDQKGNSFDIEFEVKDSGIGITKEQQAKLFDPFEQADGSISRKYGGTGLGLAISKQMVEMLGGSIRVESAYGEGTSFIFYIHAEQEKQKAGADNKKAESDSKGAITKSAVTNYDFSGLKVLIAEDIEVNREIVTFLLEETGIEIDFAYNGKHAFDMFVADPGAYAIILMDIHMPEVDGLGASKMIRQLDTPKAKTIPIIAMTADVFQEDIEKCIEAGMDAHVGKPLDAAALMGKISAFCCN